MTGDSSFTFVLSHFKSLDPLFFNKQPILNLINTYKMTMVVIMIVILMMMIVVVMMII